MKRWARQREISQPPEPGQARRPRRWGCGQVLKPGGQFLCLEFSRLVLPGLRELYDAYSFNVIPQIGRRAPALSGCAVRCRVCRDVQGRASACLCSPGLMATSPWVGRAQPCARQGCTLHMDGQAGSG